MYILVEMEGRFLLLPTRQPIAIMRYILITYSAVVIVVDSFIKTVLYIVFECRPLLCGLPLLTRHRSSSLKVMQGVILGS